MRRRYRFLAAGERQRRLGGVVKGRPGALDAVHSAAQAKRLYGKRR
jgi:hypothetical protein